MSHIRVTVSRVDDEDGQHKELSHVDFPAEEVDALQAETLFDDLEATTQETGNMVLRQILQARWATIDATVTEQYRDRVSP
jgi:hypothetical protein